MANKKKVSRTAKPRIKTATRRKAVSRSSGRRAQSKEAIRKRIVNAALALFRTKGFDATTTKAIARKAGIAEGVQIRTLPKFCVSIHPIECSPCR